MTAYVAGSAAGGVTLGALLGLAGAAVPSGVRPGAVATGMVVATLGLAGAALDLRLFGVRLPTVHRQVDESWLPQFRGWVVGIGYGFQLGLGVVTIATTAAVYLTWVLAVLTASPLAGAAVGATFGLVRALPVLAVRRIRDPQRLGDAHRRLEHWRPWAHRAAVGLQGFGAVAVLMGVWTR
ncbi:MAG: hypothetical protein ACRDU8_02955 [Egibacteraceae bacterium]